MDGMIAYIDCKAIANRINQSTIDTIARLKAENPELKNPVLRLNGYPDMPENVVFSNGLRKDGELLGIDVIDNSNNGVIPDACIQMRVNDPHIINVKHFDGGCPDVDAMGTKPAVTAAVMAIVNSYVSISGELLKGQFVLVIGKGTVGRTVADSFRGYGATVCCTDSKTDIDRMYNLMEAADIIVAAAPSNVKYKLRFKLGQKDGFPAYTTIIDVGNNFDRAAFLPARNLIITPTKGGIGVITRAIVMGRVVVAYQDSHGFTKRDVE